MKKYLPIILAVLLTASALTGCTGQANVPGQSVGINANALAGTPEPEDMPDNSFSKEECQKLSALQFDDYQHMTVSKFQNKVWMMADTAEYQVLLERLSKDEALYRLKDSDETASFLFYILEPLTAENWQTRGYSGAAESDLPAPAENARLEYTFTLTVLNADVLMVKDYNDTRLGVISMMQDVLKNKTKEELRSKPVMLADIQAYLDDALQYMQTPELHIDIEYAYFPLSAENDTPANEHLPDDAEQRRYPNGTEEDYRSLLTLKTSDYASMSVADFNAKLLAWADEDFDRTERIDADTQRNDFRVELSDEERDFVRLTVFLSGTENGKFIQSNYTGRPEADPTYHQSLPQKFEMDNRQPVWCDFSYQYSYHIADKSALTVGERDRCVGSMITAVGELWNNTTLDDLLSMTKNDMLSRLNALAAEYSTDGIVISISAEQLHFEHTEERAELP